jgi:AcrR family transcriptional regulator
MPRWEPDARERRVVAALQLFSEQGYDETTVAVIADRAGLTESTFHRHSPDKRAVLAAGQETLSRDPGRIQQGVRARWYGLVQWRRLISGVQARPGRT